MTLRHLVLRISGMLAGTYVIIAFFGELRRTSGFAEMMTLLVAWFIVVDVVAYFRHRSTSHPAGSANGPD